MDPDPLLEAKQLRFLVLKSPAEADVSSRCIDRCDWFSLGFVDNFSLIQHVQERELPLCQKHELRVDDTQVEAEQLHSLNLLLVLTVQAEQAHLHLQKP